MGAMQPLEHFFQFEGVLILVRKKGENVIFELKLNEQLLYTFKK